MDTNVEGEVRLNEEGKRIPTKEDGPMVILRYLMTFCVCPDDMEYNIRAVDYLLKKLQDRTKQLHELIETITWRGKRPSNCFTVPRTLDGRFQVAARKAFPHVVYARIWRWGDLGKAQIIHLPTCKHAFDLNLEQICVNPYHYKKITTAEEFQSKLKLTLATEANRTKAKALKKSKEATCTKNTAVKEEKKPQQQQKQVTCQLNTESLIPIVVEHHSNATENVEPQQSHVAPNKIEEPKVQPPIPETYPIGDTLYASNNVESTVPSGTMNDQRGHSNNIYNVNQPAIENNLHEQNNVQLMQGHEHNQNNITIQLHNGIQENENNRNVQTPAMLFSLPNNQRQNNFITIINLPAPSNTLLVNNPPLVSNYNQISKDLPRSDIESVAMCAMPPPPPMNQLPPAVPMDLMPPPPLPINLMPPPVPRNKVPPSVITNEMPPPRKIPLSSNSMFVNSNREITQPPPSSTPLPHNPPMFSDSLFEDEDIQPIKKQHYELQTNCSKKSENKNMSLNCTIERILKEDQQTVGHNPLENTLNETLDQILSQVQSNDRKLSNTDQKLESAVLTNSKDLNDSKDLANDSVPMEVSNYKENTQDNNRQLHFVNNASNLIQNIEALSPIRDVPLKHYRRNYENKETSLNCTFEQTVTADCTIEQILNEDNSQQTANNNPLENTLNETLDQILCQVQNNNHKLLNTDKKLESAVFSNADPIITQSNTEQLLNSNKNLANHNVPMEVNNYEEKTQDNQQLEYFTKALNLIPNIKVVSPISNVSPKNYSHKFEKKDTSLNYSIEKILNEDCTIEQILNEDNSQQTENNNPLENTLNETLDQILSQVQSNDQKLSNTDHKMESAVLISNDSKQIETQSNIEQLLNSNKDLANHNVPMEVNNYEEKTQENQQLIYFSKALNLIPNIKVVSPISNVSPKNYSHKIEKKDTSLNYSIEKILNEDCTIERILKEGDNEQTAMNNPLDNILNETLDQILSQVQNNNQKQSNTDQNLESAVLSNNAELMTTQNNIEKVLNSNEDLVDGSVPMEVNNYKPASPISDVPSINSNQKLENKDSSLNCTLEQILTEDFSLQRVLKEDGIKKNNNPTENTLNETVDQILSEVQNGDDNNDKTLLSTEQNLENVSLNNTTKTMTPQSNNDEVLKYNKDLAYDIEPMDVSDDEAVIEQNDNQQLQPISSNSELAENINAISPISAISSISPASTVRLQSPSHHPYNTQSPSEHFHCVSTSKSLDSFGNKNTGESSKFSKQKRSQSDTTVFSDDDPEETMTQNNNKRKNNSLHFNDSMMSLINNNIMEQPQMSSKSKCKQYLRNQSREINSPAYILTPPNDNNNPEQEGPSSVHPRNIELDRSKFNEFFNIPNMNFRNPRNVIPNDDPPLEHWCSIDYFELDTQVGDTFKIKNEYTTVVVDGYLDPDGGNRVCLGRLTNLHRTAQIDRTRMHIAQGIALELRDEGDIWLTCRSKTSVFIKAPFLDMQSDPSNRNSVHKIVSGECKKVFDMQKCYKHIKAQIASAQAALKVKIMTIGPPGRPIDNLSGTKGLEAIGMNIDDLRRFCILQISFVKGWGSDYPRQTIKETPCWIEVHISKALQILDNFLLLEKPIVRGMD